MFRKAKRVDGFTLLELLVVMGILGVLTSTGMLYFFDMMRSGRDTAALSDANNLMTVVSSNFVGDESVNYETQNGQQLGVADAAGVARDPVFTLSAGVVIVFAGGFNNMSFGENDNTPGQFNANLYHSSGTPGREVQIIVDELNEIQEFIVW
ncbi:MAG: type II secretion system protein [Deltaproteobacteria bacterium]|nr:type II secretion system protein [Deltaproteobacteria bacterium]